MDDDGNGLSSPWLRTRTESQQQLQLPIFSMVPDTLSLDVRDSHMPSDAGPAVVRQTRQWPWRNGVGVYGAV
ncbi:hypothetical protein GWK47_034526 [Chionoecetes opilio]|uniref:Uncharacterized protein n=1 Tax=Chionoecetes opilio TaxID=41210 RepID=A0A8J4YGC3_CHIOP|nr:hypothetical protein GWK47_034526 [Chionoecetes opilio]